MYLWFASNDLINIEIKFYLYVDKKLKILYNFFIGGENMEKMLEIILEEIKGVKKEVHEIRTEVKETKQEFRSEMQDMKQELRSEMQDMKQEILEVMDKKLEETKTELRDEMDKRFSKQSEEIAHELNSIVIFLEGRDNELKKEINGIIKVQNEILKELERNRAEHEAYNARLYKIELAQTNLEERLLKSS